MAERQHVEITSRGAVPAVTIRRPELHNALDEHVIVRFNEMFEDTRAFRENRSPHRPLEDV